MFKLVVLSALLAVAAAAPSLIEAPVVHAAPAVAVQETHLAQVGAVVKSIPTAVSHQSQSVVHSSAHVVEDIVAPVVRTAYAAPVVHAAPIVRAVAPAVHTYAAAPVVHSVAAPVVHSVVAPISVAASSPLTYTATGIW